MTRRNTRRFLSLENLEGRQLMAADAFAFTDPAAPAPATVATASIFDSPFGSPTWLFDRSLSATVVPSPYIAGKNQIVIDGSDYEDRITIRNYVPGATNDRVTLDLSQWDGGTQISSRTITLDCGKLDTDAIAITIKAKDGGDHIYNQTNLNMHADGGRGNDIIRGGNGGNTIQGGSGRNDIQGGGGIDIISGGSDRDIIIGWGGDDILSGYGGDDDIYGDSTNNDSTIASGNDRIDGGEGNDKIWGGRGDDEITAGAGHDVVFAGIGNDKIWGGAGQDTLYGEKGNDTIWGEGDIDRIFGGDDNDTLDGGNGGSGGVDYLEGGAGRDTFYRHLGLTWTGWSSDGDIFSDFNFSDDAVNDEYHW